MSELLSGRNDHNGIAGFGDEFFFDKSCDCKSSGAIDPEVFWRGDVPIDEHGLAKVRFHLYAAPASFHVVAVVSAGLNRFGTGRRQIAGVLAPRPQTPPGEQPRQQ